MCMMILESKMCVTMVSNDYQKYFKKGLKNIFDILLQQNSLNRKYYSSFKFIYLYFFKTQLVYHKIIQLSYHQK